MHVRTVLSTRNYVTTLDPFGGSLPNGLLLHNLSRLWMTSTFPHTWPPIDRFLMLHREALLLRSGRLLQHYRKYLATLWLHQYHFLLTFRNYDHVFQLQLYFTDS